MEFKLIYFSGTGNTELITEQIMNRIVAKGYCVSMISVEDRTSLEDLFLEDQVVGIGFPVYKFTYPDNLELLLDLLNKKARNNKVFVYSTYTRFRGDAVEDFSWHLQSMGNRVIAQDAFKAPSCGISSRLDYNNYEYKSVMFFEDDICNHLDAFVDTLCKAALNNTFLRLKQPNPIKQFRNSIVADIEKTKYPLLQIKAEACSKCGKCVRQCPNYNLSMGSNGVDIEDPYGCLHCLRCMHHCPKNAISFGSLTRGKNQYSKKTRDMMFDKANNGYREPYWEKFDQVVKRWRKNTLKYWIRHRNKPEL